MLAILTYYVYWQYSVTQRAFKYYKELERQPILLTVGRPDHFDISFCRPSLPASPSTSRRPSTRPWRQRRRRSRLHESLYTLFSKCAQYPRTLILMLILPAKLVDAIKRSPFKDQQHV